MSVFRTLAAGSFDGTAVAILSATKISAIARTALIANGSWDLTLEDLPPTGKVIVKVQGRHVAAHNLTPDYLFVPNTTTLRITLRDDTGALTDADFDVEIKRIAA